MITLTTRDILLNAKAQTAAAALLGSEVKNNALRAAAQSLIENTDEILAANKLDVEAAQAAIGEVMTDRLRLDEDRIAAMAKGLTDVADLPDPVGRVIDKYRAENGLVIKKVSVPLGVVAIIYESRPNVTSDAAALCLKSGNVCVLRGGKEAFRSNTAIVGAMRSGIAKCGLNENMISLVTDTSRQSAADLMTAVGFVDLLIPRGGAGLIRACTENAKVPCIQTGTGICHIYVDKSADFDKALKIINNAKTQRPSVCNAAEVCLVNADIANKFLPLLYKTLVTDRINADLKPVELRLDNRAAEIIDGTPAGKDDFDTEFLDYKMAVAVVDDTDAAIKHISKHSTGHSESVITQDDEQAQKFIRGVDSAAVYVNASTRFTDGGCFGLGCEMGISTQKLHARGPMGLNELTSYKYIITGNGQIRE